MSLNLTYGSFGDAITTAQLVYRLAQALSASRGSAREVQDLVVELRLFQNVLQQLILFWESRKQCSELDDLANIARPAILDCKDTIEAFLKRVVTKYGKSLLRRVGSRKTVWDVIKMIQWNLYEKEDVKKLQDQLGRSKATIQMVQVQAHGLASDQNQKLVSDRITSLVDAEREAETRIDERFAELMANLEKGDKTLSRIEEAMNLVSSTMSSISSNVLAIHRAAVSIEQGVTMLHGMMSRLSLYGHNTIYIEDALGWMLPIILDSQPSWETIHSILKDQFARHRSPGLKLVESKRYSIQDIRTGRDANSTKPFYQVARPGQKFAMSIIFNGDWVSEDEHSKEKSESKCPSCKYVNMIVDPDGDVTCQQCQLIYRIMIDVSDMDEEHLNEWMAHQRPLHTHNRGENHEDGDEDDAHEASDKVIEALIQENLSSSEIFPDGPGIFKRVKFLTRWEDRPESRGSHSATIGDIHFWSISRQGAARMASFQMVVSAAVQLSLYWHWILDCQPGVATPRELAVMIRAGFVGRSLEQSLPVIVVITYSKRIRRRAVKVLKLLDWLGMQSRFLILAPPPAAFGNKEWFMGLKSNVEVKRESLRRLAVIKRRNPQPKLL